VEQSRGDVQPTSYIFHAEGTSFDELKMLEWDTHVNRLESLFEDTGTEDVLQWCVGVVCEVGFETLQDFRSQSVLCGQKHLRSDTTTVKLPAELLRSTVEVQRHLRTLYEADSTVVLRIEDFTLEVGNVALRQQQRLCTDVARGYSCVNAVQEFALNSFTTRGQLLLTRSTRDVSSCNSGWVNVVEAGCAALLVTLSVEVTVTVHQNIVDDCQETVVGG
jgi:hypothetical protein